MNHWFLCARDVMWFIIASSPLFLSMIFGMATQKNEELDMGYHCLLIAGIIQFIGISMLLEGVIK